MFSKEYLQNMSDKTGFLAESLQKQLTLLLILREISRHPILRKKFALKGGTAINLFWLPLPRLSVDIDLNYKANVDRSKMLQDRPLLEEQLKKLIESMGISVEHKPINEHAGGKWRLRAQSALGGNFALELDLNYMMRVPIWGIYLRQPHIIDEDYIFKFNSVSFEELLAGKVKALLERASARDLYDITTLSEFLPLYDISRLKRACLILGITSKQDWRQFDYQIIDKIDPKMVKEELTSLLRQNESVKIDYIKLKAKKILAQVLNYDERDEEFLEIFFEQCEYKPELIFSAEESARLKHHPAVLWKLQNMRKFKGLE